ncbi:MAG: hypothetical protein M9949_01210 [Candidatus Kapabacteria bacterium]|nr:hypothetical protein [Candidatus Kapabacteria bacterium]
MSLVIYIKRFLPTWAINFLKSVRQIFRDKNNSGNEAPPVPHSAKQSVLRKYKNRYKINNLVETGTYLGDMVEAMREEFTSIYSVELDMKLFKMAEKRFAKFPHITILQGDSGQVLYDLVPKLNAPTLFWLDGHYSQGITAKGDKDCPIYEELGAILQSDFGHVLLIDDATYFNGEGDYPTIEALSQFISKHKNISEQIIEHDIICIVLD